MDIPVLDRTYISGANLTGKRGYYVKLSGTNAPGTVASVVLCGAGDRAVGVLQTDGGGKDGGSGVGIALPVSVRVLGSSFAVAGGTISAAGTAIKPDTNGRGVAASGGDIASAVSECSFTLPATPSGAEAIDVLLTGPFEA